MIAFILANWKGLAGAAAAFALSLMLHKLDVVRIEARHQTELAQQAKSLVAKCDADKAITKEVSHDYQNKIADLTRRVAAAKRLYRNACVEITADAAAGHDATSGSGKPSGSGVTGTRLSSSSLIDYLAEGDKYRVQLQSCQSFITRTWAAAEQR